MYEGQPRGFPFGDFDLADVMLPEDDDMDIPSGSDEEQEEDLQTESGFSNVLGAGRCRSACLCVVSLLPPAAACMQELRSLAAAAGAVAVAGVRRSRAAAAPGDGRACAAACLRRTHPARLPRPARAGRSGGQPARCAC